MAGDRRMRRGGGEAAIDRDQQQPTERPPFKCEANGCTLPAVFLNDSHKRLCRCHFGASQDGWDKATEVANAHSLLMFAAVSASVSSAPDCSSEQLARDLFTMAKDAGLTFPDDLRARYRAAPMKLRFAGAAVEAAIRQQAIDAASACVPIPVGERRESPLARLVSGMANQIRMRHNQELPQ